MKTIEIPEWAIAPDSIQCRECLFLQDFEVTGEVGDYRIYRRENHHEKCSRHKHNGEII